ncbi:hypothetical protein Glove_421g143 [Diversispora epigaea]|uniref:C2H2-type domain-containing protein n=1 Tax=Diversispora epigaea TaxID=1348612 RepID=A0A397GZX4_9GLOM|nr:hypothetical protein Glove_421g146 [Diversispora epigaea]RHZ54960.1 hypothetical protein Glove_421g143 [Diversispora epigaea]
MPKDFKCLYCDRYFSSRQAYVQHVNRTHYDINDTSLDDKDFNRINRFEEMQTGWEESLPSITNENEEYKDQNMPPVSHEYEDVLENTNVVSNFSKNYDINQTSQSNFDQSDLYLPPKFKIQMPKSQMPKSQIPNPKL